MTTATKERQCVSGADPDVRYRLPLGFGEFYQALDLQDIAELLIEQKLKGWPEGEGRPTVSYFWKAKGGARSGRGIYGKLSKATGLVGALLGTDYVLWLAADHIKALEFTNYQVEALLFHEMLHIAIEVENLKEDGTCTLKFTTRGHDVEEFTEVIEEYGLWEQDLRAFSHAIQARLALG